MAKHYVKVNEDNFVTAAFSDAFTQPVDGDICVNEDGGRHYNLDRITFKRVDSVVVYTYKLVDGKVVERSREELYPLKAIKAFKKDEVRDMGIHLMDKSNYRLTRFAEQKAMNLTTKDSVAEMKRCRAYRQVLRNRFKAIKNWIDQQTDYDKVADFQVRRDVSIEAMDIDKAVTEVEAGRSPGIGEAPPNAKAGREWSVQKATDMTVNIPPATIKKQADYDRDNYGV